MLSKLTKLSEEYNVRMFVVGCALYAKRLAMVDCSPNDEPGPM